ncbi:hypothetical protein P153DRAFT_389711 [Dothidotthia symphoricarpi CBS 119687]|uniref:Uncharacterized protein n=1 Tax=Dothidotthia symphoricarpi CBS 119687 TaxID=1392245 RepID=A0A6A6A321_9PLEO|nr:uncharacterized protein P153DRAFT_389711 [Dothidotthia symphoricarpi CBS 119687]KAF2125563.1 hypothetical protein P153DRAFT_389711 [Dothidotthia symphoricarpi CBS 119687]
MSSPHQQNPPTSPTLHQDQGSISSNHSNTSAQSNQTQPNPPSTPTHTNSTSPPPNTPSTTNPWTALSPSNNPCIHSHTPSPPTKHNEHPTNTTTHDYDPLEGPSNRTYVFIAGGDGRVVVRADEGTSGAGGKGRAEFRRRRMMARLSVRR